MPTLSNHGFGLTIAYLLPGFTALWSLSPFWPALAIWLEGGTTHPSPTVGGFLYVTLASLIAGLILNAIRWATFDQLNAHLGLKRPAWDEAKLQANQDAFQSTINYHFRYYQFYACMLLAVVPLHATHRFIIAEPIPSGWADLAALLLLVLFGAAQRNALKQYYARSESLLKPNRKQTDET